VLHSNSTNGALHQT